MIAVLERRDALAGVPKVIASEVQNERYISALLEMQRRGNLTAAEKNLAEVSSERQMFPNLGKPLS